MIATFALVALLTGWYEITCKILSTICFRLESFVTIIKSFIGIGILSIPYGTAKGGYDIQTR